MATVKGVVVTRRDAYGLKAGRARHLLQLAKDGFLTHEKEALEWRRIGNVCAICWEPTTLEEIWSGPGKDKPVRVEIKDAAMTELLMKPVKVIEAYVCGECRCRDLGRMKFFAQ